MLLKALKRAAKLTGKWTPNGEFLLMCMPIKVPLSWTLAATTSAKPEGCTEHTKSSFYDVVGGLFESFLYLDEKGGTEKRNHGLIKEITLLLRDRAGECHRVVIQ